ncbi:HAMP domain-containing histidine kinase [Kribbella antibiotica]|uniref:histidine kinase n=1 Tax=Kribbella antibiotica TaxID=190195 RepID=A0A4R4ZNC0_9ACTN|nr:HAMP domain-containing sensor histidine kinase [Kribbella antibiotica]TDD59626.1 HAMP domain-containing histidine kinase [Kribbella antibiotica]
MAADVRGSLRTRTTVAATAVVAVALVIAGLAVVLLLRANLGSQAQLQAEVTAQQLASQLAGGTAIAKLDLDDESPVRITDAKGNVLAASEKLTELNGQPVQPPRATPSKPGGSTTAPPKPATTPRPSTPSSTVTDDDDGDDDDKSPGRDEPDDDDTSAPTAPPDPGRVAEGDAEYSTGSATVDGRTAEYRFAALKVKLPKGAGDVTVQAGAELATARDAVSTVSQSMLIGLPLLLAIVALVTWMVTRRALAPVEAIRTELAGITGSRDLRRRVPVPESRDEVARLARTTNDTLTALETSVAQQRAFVADASHELRSPIASLRTQLEVAAAHPELLELDELIADTVRLQHLAADLLLLARLDAGDHVDPQRLYVADLVRDAIDGRRATMVIDAEPVVLGNKSRLERILGNLLDNAERHTGKAIRVVISEAGGQAMIQVQDDGPGVPEADRERIFERFVRLDDARSRDEGGAGLGLAIARDLAQAHEGTLTAHTSPLGGASFDLRLPLAT